MSNYGDYISIDEYGYIDYNEEDESKWGWLAARTEQGSNLIYTKAEKEVEASERKNS
jgi:hypothetical protein